MKGMRLIRWIVLLRGECGVILFGGGGVSSSVGRVLMGVRTEQKYRDLFAEAGFKIKRTELQKGWPKGLNPVRMFALQPGKV